MDIVTQYYIVAMISIVVLVDIITSVVKVKNISSTLKKIEALNDEIKEKLKEIKLMKGEVGKTAEELTVNKNIQEIIDKLNKKKRRTMLHLYKNVYRLKKAFPAIDTKEIAEVLSQKIEHKKKTRKNT